MTTYRIDVSKRYDHQEGDQEIWEKTFWCNPGNNEVQARHNLFFAREINTDSWHKPVFRLVQVDGDTETVLDD